MKGPIKTDVQILGPYRHSDTAPEAWCYLDSGKIEVHLQADGPDGLNHYILRARVIKKRKKS